MRDLRWILAAATCAALVGCSDSGDGDTDTTPADTATGDTASGDAATDDAASGDTASGDTGQPPASTCEFPAGAEVDNAELPAGFCGWIWADGLSQPRGLTIAPGGDVLVVERGGDRISALYDADGDGVSGSGERVVLVELSGLNHGIVIEGAHLYASTATRVVRWPYTDGQRTALTDMEMVVRDIPGGGHQTRTLIFDDQGRLYVSVGSLSNVDSDSRRSRIMRYIVDSIPSGGIPWGDGEVFADGLRNEVGLAFDGQGRLWGVENGSDNLSRADLGGDIHEENPSEELNLFAEPGLFYGYPYCWSEGELAAGDGPGTQWAYPNGPETDAWCKDTDNVVPPMFNIRAHSAPLGLIFYDGAAFPADWQGDAIVPLHGSWNAAEQRGYKVVRVTFDGSGPTGVEELLAYDGAGDTGPGWPHRPVDVQLDGEGKALVTSDSSGVIFAIGYAP